ncbi:hypothetical protein MYX04_11790, partial [Nitrospiraceae bacterium AH_259_D15_M11_P09]|nr:hypothetical protein [Nitrospiraceae bacterium AH_259_D15_M11_P09]
MKSQHAATNQIRQQRKKLQPVTDHKCARLKCRKMEVNVNWVRVGMRIMLVLTLVSALLGPVEVRAQSMADYTAVPPFLTSSSSKIPPDILIILDNSQTMNSKAHQSAFDPNKT